MRFALVLALVALSAGCGAASSPRPRDVVVITVDTWRHDAAGFAGNARIRTPAIDRLAAEGIVFSNARAHAVVTLPSHASLLTGRLPFEHGARDNGGFALNERSPTLASWLRARGFRTAAFVSAFPLDGRFGLDAGFDLYDDAVGAAGSGAADALAQRDGAATVALALAWWRANPSPRFLWVHVFTPHFPYDAPEPFASRWPDQPYFAEVERTDAELAPLLEALRAEPGPGPLVVLTADHGESLGEHGEATHGLFAYDATAKVPLVVWERGTLAPAAVDRPVGHVDVVPTVCARLGIAAPDGLPGRSLLDGGEVADTYVEAMAAHLHRGAAPLAAVVRGRYKAIRLPEPELYDLEADPGERRNLAPVETSRYEALVADLPKEAYGGLAAAPVDDDAAARLRSLGYLVGTSDRAGVEDPKHLVEEDRAIDAALGAWRRGDRDAAVTGLRRLLERRPRCAPARSHLAGFLTDLGRLDEAAEALAPATDETSRVRRALLMLRRGDTAAASALLAPFGDSADPETQSALGRVAAVLGNRVEARGRFERALALDPTYPEGLADLGTLLLDTGDVDGARARLEAAVAAAPSLAEAWNGLGVVRARSADDAGAIDAWDRAVEADPTLADAWFNLAAASARGRAWGRAAAALERYAALVDGEDRARALELLRRVRAGEGGRG
ncbi:MAG TPA: sulfatase-like hydrolase/transferase [Candidatus Polarisedimenticolaceae bacterium]